MGYTVPMKRISLTLPLFAALAACACDEIQDEPAAETERFWHPPQVGQLETVAEFNHGPPPNFETPESVLVGFNDEIYISMALTGEIRKIEPDGSQSTFATLPIGVPLQPCGGLVGIVGAMAGDILGNVYVNVASCEAENRGVWRIDADGNAQKIASFGFDVLPNGIATFLGQLYIADSSGKVWRVPMTGGTPEVWADGPLLAQSGAVVPVTPPIPTPGPNGIQFFKKAAYVANSSQGTIVKIPFKKNGSAGTPEVYHTFEDPDVGCDDFAFDIIGRIYCTTDPAHTVIRIDRDHSEHILFDADDGLDGPTAAMFGRFDDRRTLYITNAQFPFFDEISPNNGPSLQKVELALPGYPFR